MEYELQQRSVGPPVFLFVVDTCLPESELESLKDSIQQTLNLLPEDALVGLITFGAHVLVHEIGLGEFLGAIRVTQGRIAASAETIVVFFIFGFRLCVGIIL